MTSVEKRTLLISLAALAVSMISPVATYFLLDPTMKQFALRGKLLVKPTYQATYMRDIKPDGATDSALVLSILNTGKLPAKDVSIVARFPAVSSHFVAPTTTPDLLIELDSHSTPAVAYMTLKRPIAPGDSVLLRFTSVPQEVVCANDFGEVTRIAANWSVIATGVSVSVR